MKKTLLVGVFILFALLCVSASQAAIIPPPPPPEEPADEDNDGIIDEEDLCLGSAVDTMDLNPNHHAWFGGEYFTTKDPKTKDLVASEYSLTETQGCTCAQILAQKPGNNNGELKYGCTRGTMKNFLK